VAVLGAEAFGLGGGTGLMTGLGEVTPVFPLGVFVAGEAAGDGDADAAAGTGGSGA